MRKECMCHVQKWLRTRLKTPQRTLKGKILSDGKIPEAVLKQKNYTILPKLFVFNKFQKLSLALVAI